MESLSGSQVLDREGYRKWGFPFQNYHSIGTSGIPRYEVVVYAVSQAIGRFKGSGWPGEDILLEQQPVLEWNDVVTVFCQRVRCIANLFDFVVHPSGLLRMELEPRMGLDAVESRLVKELDPTGTIVSGDVVHDLERRTARKVEINMTERPLADRWQNMGAVYRVVM